MRLDTLARAELFAEIADVARDQGAATAEVWNELVDEVVDAHVDLGELDRDQNLIGLKTSLQEMWDEYKRRAEAEGGGTIQDVSLETPEEAQP